MTTEAFLNAGRGYCLFALSPNERTGELNSVKETDQVVLDERLAEMSEPVTKDIIKHCHESLTLQECKLALVELISKLKGENEELKQIETLVNTLEERHTPILTLEFYNMALGGTWKFIFSTKNVLRQLPRGLRLGKLIQTIQPEGLSGNVTNCVHWELVQDGTPFDSLGTFSINCSYNINGGKLEMLYWIHNNCVGPFH